MIECFFCTKWTNPPIPPEFSINIIIGPTRRAKPKVLSIQPCERRVIKSEKVAPIVLIIENSLRINSPRRIPPKSDIKTLRV